MPRIRLNPARNARMVLAVVVRRGINTT